jgi:outer membrane protein OmpA-like peptidoglycan-associated protein
MRRVAVVALVFVLCGCRTAHSRTTLAPPSRSFPAAFPIEPNGSQVIPTEPIPQLATATPATSTATTTPGSSATADPGAACTLFIVDGAGFAVDRWDLPASVERDVRSHIRLLKSGTYHRVVVVGFTDSRPSPLGNVELGLRRAQSVVGLLRDLGIESAAESRGDTEPVDGSDSDEAHAANRRIEVQASCR